MTSLFENSLCKLLVVSIDYLLNSIWFLLIPFETVFIFVNYLVSSVAISLYNPLFNYIKLIFNNMALPYNNVCTVFVI